MQVYAFDENRLISTSKAEKGKNYNCPECLGLIRLRGGKERQNHFFHLHLNPSCRQSQKGIVHLHLQFFIKNLFKNAEMEKQFPQIGRIADVFDPETKTIFEIQCSPISLEEAKLRCHDYEKMGYRIVWILHDNTFNQKRISSSEQFLRSKTCYFSNMTKEGKGLIYDQIEEIRGTRRLFSGYFTPVNLQIANSLPSFKWPKELVLRAQTWPFYHEGDLLDHALKNKFLFPKKLSKKKLIHQLKEIYLTGLHILLEKTSR